jgi:hypothetical protein
MEDQMMKTLFVNPPFFEKFDGGAMPGMNPSAPSMNSTARSWFATAASNA